MQLGKFCFLFFFRCCCWFYLLSICGSSYGAKSHLLCSLTFPSPLHFLFLLYPLHSFFANLPFFFFSFSIYSSFSFLCFLANVNQTVSNVIAGGKLKHAILLAASEAEARSAEALLKRAQ